ncbi:MAG: amidohydrolase [Bryobacteraceae bacterium]|nr:amidohydrolase [Bryobacteraceae bacterium]
MLASALLAACNPVWAAQGAADLIVYHGKIVTVDPRFRIARALAVRDGRILATGSDAEILKLAGPKTEKLDLQGKTVLPGLIDSHVHAPAASMFEFDHPVPDMESIQDVLAYVRARAAALPPGQWIVVSQVFITRLKEQRYPTRRELDEAAPHHPVVFRTGPDASLNSLALERSGIDRNFKVTDGQPCRVERDATGEPTGILRNCGRFLRVAPSEPKATREDRLRRLKELLADYNSVGLTSIVDANTQDDEVELYRLLKERGELSCRTFLTLHVDAQAPLEQIEARLRKAARDPLHRYDNLLWLRGVKTFLDGGMLTGSAFMLQPWGISPLYGIEDPTYRGMRFIEPDKLYRIAREALRHGFQFTAHAQGDGAVETLLEAYERIDKNDFPVRDRRPNMSHASFMTREAIATMKRLGVVANMQPPWLYLDGRTLLRHFGQERLRYFHPYKTLFEEGVIVGGGSDHMQKIGSRRSINPYNPFLGIWIVLTRRPRWLDQPLGPEQALSREQAIRLYTINNAYLTFQEKQKGSLEAGKLADFIILDRDILTCAVDEIPEIQVERTYLGGRLVYQRPEPPRIR